MKDYKIESKEQHKRVLDNIVAQMANGELVNKGKVIKDAGYSKQRLITLIPS